MDLIPNEILSLILTDFNEEQYMLKYRLVSKQFYNIINNYKLRLLDKYSIEYCSNKRLYVQLERFHINYEFADWGMGLYGVCRHKLDPNKTLIMYFINKLYKNEKENISFYAFRGACLGGNLNTWQFITDYLTKNNLFLDCHGFDYACKGGHKDIMSLTIDNAQTLIGGFRSACDSYKESNIDIINVILENKDHPGWTTFGNISKYDYNKGLVKACEKGNRKIVEKLLELGADNYLEGLYAACKYKYPWSKKHPDRSDISNHIVSFMIAECIKHGKYGDIEWDEQCVPNAANNIEILNIIKSFGFNITTAMYYTYDNNFKLALIQECKLLNIKFDWQSLLALACNSGYLDNVIFVIKNSEDILNIADGFINAYYSGHKEIILYLLDKHSDKLDSIDWNVCLRAACNSYVGLVAQKRKRNYYYYELVSIAYAHGA